MVNEYSIETEKGDFKPSYKEFSVESFQEAVEEIIHGDDIEERFVLLDIDGVLFPDIDKLPVIELIRNTQIEDIDQAYIMHLKEIYNDNIAIVTDRNPNLNLFLSSKDIVEKVKKVNDPSEEPIPIFHSLNKQFCGKTNQKKDALVDHIAKQLGECKHITLTSIEDHTFTVPKRDLFLKYIADKLYSNYQIESNIQNYVVKRK